MANKYQKGLDFLANRGVNVLSTQKTLFGYKAEGEYRFGQEKASLSLSYSSLGKSMSVELSMPYDPFSKDLQGEYDRLFPEEKNMWGRSSPSFPQAIKDYLRGQKHSSNLVELREHGKLLYIRIGVAGLGKDGFLSCLQKASLEFRKGLLHADVLFHLFAA